MAEHPEAQSSNMAQEEPASYGKPPLLVSYKVPFSLRLRYTVTSIAHFFRIMEQPQNYAESPEFLPLKNGQRIDSYRDSLSLLYLDPKMAHLSHDHWKLAEIKTYKDKDTKVKHEYVIATFTDGDRGEVLLRIERRIRDSSLKALGKASMRTEPNTSDIDSGTEDAAQPIEEKAKTFKKKAVDEVTLVRSNPPSLDSQELVQHVAFAKKKSITLPCLIVVACATNDYAKEYHFFERNCYWFCYIVTEILLKIAHDFGGHPTGGQQGAWEGLPADSLWRKVDFGVLFTKYEAMQSSFINKINSIIDHPNNKYLKEAERRVEEEKRRAEESERLLEEQKRRAEEEKRRAEEEKRRAEESERLLEEQKRRAEERAEDLERQLAELKAQLAQARV